MKFFATSDQHFLHYNIIKYAERPFDLSYQGVSKCIDTIVNNYNSVVSDDDIVFHLGDLAHGRKQTHDNIGYILSHLKGKKILIRGNHDKWEDDYYLKYFLQVREYIHVEDTFLCHYPCYESKWNTVEELEYIDYVRANPSIKKIIHGHIHQKDPNTWEPDGYQRTNVAVDFPPNNYYPCEICINKL